MKTGGDYVLYFSALHAEFVAAARAQNRVFPLFARQAKRGAAGGAFAVNVFFVFAAFFLHGALCFSCGAPVFS